MGLDGALDILIRGVRAVVSDGVIDKDVDIAHVERRSGDITSLRQVNPIRGSRRGCVAT
jgi:hypothetical protein